MHTMEGNKMALFQGYIQFKYWMHKDLYYRRQQKQANRNRLWSEKDIKAYRELQLSASITPLSEFGISIG